MRYERWYLMGTDLEGRKCPVAQVRLPAGCTTSEAVRQVNAMGIADESRRWYATVTECVLAR